MSSNHQQKPVTSMKYWLFDLAIACALVASALSAGRSLLVVSPNLLCSNSSGVANTSHDTSCEVDSSENVVNSASVVNTDTTTVPITPNDKPMFAIDDIVEVYEPNIHPNYAFHAQIVHVYIHKDPRELQQRCGNNATTDKLFVYDVRVGFGGGVTYEKLPSSSIRHIKPFSPNTRAVCDDGRMLNSKLVPCTVDYHIPNGKNFFGENSRQDGMPWLYSISYETNEGIGENGGRSRKMPMTRIRRIVSEPSLWPLEKEEESEEQDAPDSKKVASRKEQEGPSTVKSKVPTTSPVMPHQENSANDPQDTTTFPAGSVIEIYGPQGYFAFPATVTGFNPSTNGYDLTHGITRAHIKNIDSQFVHPYQIYKEGTAASCNVGKQKRIIMVPCTVLAAVHNDPSDGNYNIGGSDGDNIIYQVSAKMARDRETEQVIFIPRLRVQRRIGGRGPRSRSSSSTATA